MAPAARSPARPAPARPGRPGRARRHLHPHLHPAGSAPRRSTTAAASLLSALSAAAIIIGAVCVPAGPIARFLSLRPLVWLGTISYGAYLWHYPVYILPRPGPDRARPASALLAIRFAATFALAAASFYLVERPVMDGTFWRSLKAVDPGRRPDGGHRGRHRGRDGGAGHRRRARGPVPGPTGAGQDAPPEWWCWATAPPTPSASPWPPPPRPAPRCVNGGLFGCGLVIGTNALQQPAHAPNWPCSRPATRPPRPSAVAGPGRAGGGRHRARATSSCSWPVTGRPRTSLRNGRWTNIEQPSDQRYMLAQMRRAVQIGTAHGAHFDFTTMPALAIGAAFDEASAPRGLSDTGGCSTTSLIEEVAAQFPGRGECDRLRGHPVAPAASSPSTWTGSRSGPPTGSTPRPTPRATCSPATPPRRWPTPSTTGCRRGSGRSSWPPTRSRRRGRPWPVGLGAPGPGGGGRLQAPADQLLAARRLARRLARRGAGRSRA